MTHDVVRKLVLERPIPERLIGALAVAPLLRPHDIEVWLRCGGRIHAATDRAPARVRYPTMELNRRQRQALQLLADGVTVGMAALQLGIARQSFTNTIAEARFRLGAETVEQAMVIATTLGLVTTPTTHPEKLLSSDEELVLSLFYEGASAGELAECLEIPFNTVKTRLRTARRKLGAQTTYDAARAVFG